MFTVIILDQHSLFLQNPSKECEPYQTSDGLPIAPCGAIANSLFNGKRCKVLMLDCLAHLLIKVFLSDTLELFYVENGTSNSIPMLKKGIAWWTDKHVKFRNPGGTTNFSLAFKGDFNSCEPINLLSHKGAVTCLSFLGTSKPVNWRKPVYELDPSDADNNGFINEDFIVWMRTAALPTFRKLYRIIQKSSTTPTLPRGKYELKITYSILSR